MEKSSILAKGPGSSAIAFPGLGRFEVSQRSVQRVSLIMLVVQNSALILALHHARTSPTETGERYLSSTAVLLVECIKLLMSLAVMTYEEARSSKRQSASHTLSAVLGSLFSAGSFRLVLPAVLYTLQNTLVYIAISNLDAVTFQVTYQLKILTTVVFSIVLLGRKISHRQWLALTLLAVGISIVQISGPLSTERISLENIRRYLHSIVRPLDGLLSAPTYESQGSAGATIPWSSNVKGFMAVLAASLISGFTCVYFEKLMKSSLATVSVWTRNAQLAFFSIFPALLIGVVWQDGAKVAEQGFFAGYTPLVWVTVLLQAVGGMIVAVCIAYADNVAKNFAASLSIVVSCMVTAMFSTPASMLSTIGTLAVLLAIYLYQTASRANTGTLLPVTQNNKQLVYRKS